MNPNLILVFIKSPEIGKVKTRLAAKIGHVNAMKIYSYLLTKTLNTTNKCVADKALFYTSYIDPGFPDFRKYLQVGADLGERMKNAFIKGFEENYQKIIIVGGDIVELSTEIIQNAFEKLNNVDVVLGPAADGGYYLLGMKHLITELFEQIPWSTAEVLSKTIQRIESLKLNYLTVDRLDDIDRYEDVIKYPELTNFLEQN